MKLKQIPNNTVVHTPTEEEAKELLAILHENGYVWNIRQSLLAETSWFDEGSCYCIDPEKKHITWSVIAMENGTISLAEFKERYCVEEKPQPKFKVGDKVKVIEPNCWHSGQIGIIRKARTSSEQVMVAFGEGGAANFYSEECLEPYPEPETKDDAKDTKEETMETKEEAKELNLCELLKGHEGENTNENKLKKIWIKIQAENLSSKVEINLGDSQYCLNFQENEAKVELLVGHSSVNVNVETLKK